MILPCSNALVIWVASCLSAPLASTQDACSGCKAAPELHALDLQGSCLVQKSFRTSRSTVRQSPQDHNFNETYPIITHQPPHSTAAFPIVHHQAHPAGYEEPGDTGDAGNSVSKVLHTDTLGDALEPTHKGIGRKGSAKHAEEAAHGAAEDQLHHSYIALLFMFGCLFVGCMLLAVLERCVPTVPYTVALFVLGIMVALVHYFKPKDSMFTWPSWWASVEVWRHINPHTLFFIFLPGLIFGEAMRLNVTLVSRVFWQVFLLACPGVLLGTAMTGFVGRYVLPYGWDWPISLAFGAILSATDPVAVVALFNTLGVSPRLTMLVSGESLLNDGTAIVVFSLMLKLSMGATLDTWGVLEYFTHMTVAAAIVGFLIGRVGVAFISFCSEERYHSDAMIQVVVTLCCGYLAFFVAENEVKTSGVISTVVAGFTMAYSVWPRLVSRETTHIVWETLEFMGNTLIFFLAGVLFADTVLTRMEYIGLSDFGWLLLLYVFVMLVRAAMLLVFWVPLHCVGSALSWQEGIVMMWSGLRGAVSLALAIIVDLEPGISKERGSRVMFHVGGIAALTFLVNATTASSLLRWLGLTKTSQVKERTMTQFSMHIAEKISHTFEEELRGTEDVRFVGASRSIVRAMVPALKGPLPHFRAQSRSLDSGSESGEGSLARIYREAFLKAVQYYYWEAIEEGVLPRRMEVAQLLLHSTEEAMDSARGRLCDWDIIARELGEGKPGMISKAFSKLAQSRPFSSMTYFRRHTQDGLNLTKVIAILCFQGAHAQAQVSVPAHFGQDEAMDVLVQQQVARESQVQCRRAGEMLDRDLSRDVVEVCKSEMLARKLLQMQGKQVDELKEMGLLTSSEADHLLHQVEVALRILVKQSKSTWLNFRDNGSLPSAFPPSGNLQQQTLGPMAMRGAVPNASGGPALSASLPEPNQQALTPQTLAPVGMPLHNSLSSSLAPHDVRGTGLEALHHSAPQVIARPP